MNNRIYLLTFCLISVFSIHAKLNETLLKINPWAHTLEEKKFILDGDGFIGEAVSIEAHDDGDISITVPGSGMVSLKKLNEKLLEINSQTHAAFFKKWNESKADVLKELKLFKKSFECLKQSHIIVVDPYLIPGTHKELTDLATALGQPTNDNDVSPFVDCFAAAYKENKALMKSTIRNTKIGITGIVLAVCAVPITYFLYKHSNKKQKSQKNPHEQPVNTEQES